MRAELSHPPSSVLVVEPSLKDNQVSVHDPADETMFLGDAPRPHITGSMLESFGLPAPFTRCAERVIGEEVDSFEQASVVALPPLVVVPAGLVENEPHARSSSRAVYVPASDRSRIALVSSSPDQSMLGHKIVVELRQGTQCPILVSRHQLATNLSSSGALSCGHDQRWMVPPASRPCERRVSARSADWALAASPR